MRTLIKISGNREESVSIKKILTENADTDLDDYSGQRNSNET